MNKRLLTINFVRVLDLCLLIAAYSTAFHLSGLGNSREAWAHLASAQFSLADLMYYLLLALFWNRAFSVMDTYQSYRLSTFKTQRIAIFKASTLACAGIAFLNLLTMRNADTRFLLLLFLFGTLYELAARGAIRFTLRRLRLGGRNLRWVIIIGADERALAFGEQLMTQRELGYIVAGFIVCDRGRCESVLEDRIIGHIDEVPSLLRKLVVDEVAISLPMHTHLDAITAVARICRDHGIITRLIADSIEPHLTISRMDNVGRYGLLTVIPESRLKASSTAKSAFDVVVASSLLLLLSPVILLVALLIRFTSPGPVFYHQVRLGENKRTFRMHKFRTMVVDAEQQVQALSDAQGGGAFPFKMKNDPRITSVGRLLRKFSLDEVPQLFNVLKREMSLVGPRPLPVRDYEGFERDHHFRRFSVKPGLSCLWQISGRSDLSFEEWMQLDMQYIDQWSMWLDVKILLKTVPAVLRGEGAY